MKVYWFNISADNHKGAWEEIPIKNLGNGVVVITLNHTSIIVFTTSRIVLLSSDDGGGGGGDDDEKEAAIPYGNFYLLFIAIGIIGLIIYDNYHKLYDNIIILSYNDLLIKLYHKLVLKLIITLEFNSKSTRVDIPRAIKIAEKYKHEYENRILRVFFDDPTDKTILKLLSLVTGLKGTRLLIDGDEIKYAIYEGLSHIVKNLFDIINCNKRKTCNGLCQYTNLRFFHKSFTIIELQEYIENNSIEGVLEIFINTEFEEKGFHFEDYIRKVKDNHYELDREAMIKEILENLKNKEQKYCKIFSEKKIHDVVNQIPISIVNRGALEDQPSFEEILISLDIDPKMSEKLVYGCIKALNIISNSYSYRILFQDIRIYSSQNGESQVILKIEGENLNEELGDDKSPIIQFNDGTYFIILNTTKITFQMAKNEEEFISILRKFRLE